MFIQSMKVNKKVTCRLICTCIGSKSLTVEADPSASVGPLAPPTVMLTHLKYDILIEEHPPVTSLI